MISIATSTVCLPQELDHLMFLPTLADALADAATMPVVELGQGAFVDAGCLGYLVARQAGIVDGLPQLVSQQDGSFPAHVSILRNTGRIVQYSSQPFDRTQ